MEPPFKKRAMTETEEASAQILGLPYSINKDDKKGWCRQKFREEWCSEPQFDGWLEAVPEDLFRAWCKCCQCTLTVGRSELLKHAQTQKHKRAMIDNNTSSKVLNILESSAAGGLPVGIGPSIGHTILPTGQPVHFKGIDENVLRAELAITAFAVEHNLSGLAVQHMCELISGFSEHPDVLSKVKLSKTKCAAIAKNVLARSIHEELDEVLKQNFFSLVIEEPIMLHGCKVFCVIVRYFSDSRSKTRSDLFEAFAVEEKGVNTDNLCKVIKDIIMKRKVPLQNIIGIAADLGSPLYSDLELLKSELFVKNDEAILFNCVYHSMTTVASVAIATLPQTLEQLMIYYGNFVTGNAKYFGLLDLPDISTSESKLVFEATDPGHWLITGTCVSELLQHFVMLTSILEKDAMEGTSQVGDELLTEAVNPFIKAYFLFLNYVLTLVYTMGELFQSEDVLIHQLLKECQAQFRVICQHFMTPSAFMVEDLTKVDPYNEQNLLPLKDVFVGFDCRDYIKDLDPELNAQFLDHCRKFFQVVVLEIQNRVPLSSPVLDHLLFLDPDVALKTEGRTALPSLDALGANFPRYIDCSKLKEEWLSLPQYFSASDADELKKLPIDSMWGIIADMRNSNDVPAFPMLGKLAKLTLSLPLSDHEVASISKMLVEHQHYIKSRNLTSTLQTLLPLKHSMKQDATECHKLRVTSKHRKFYYIEITKKEEFAEDETLFARDDN